MTQRDDFVAVALAEVGRLQYTPYGDRCGWTDGTTDCSGLVSGSAKRVGYALGGCPNSSALSRLCHQAVRPQWMNDTFGPDPWTGSSTLGTGISQIQARNTKGALKFHGLDQGMNGDGPTGHVAISMGDGRSVEALNSALDVRVWTFIDSDTTYTALLPGMTGFDQQPGSNPNPMSAWEAEAMQMVAIVVPGSHVQHNGPLAGRMPFVAAKNNSDTTCDIIGFNGAQLPASINAQGHPIQPVNDFGLSVLHLGHLNQPIAAVSNVLNAQGQATGGIVFLALDGGTFGPYVPHVHYA